jgi:hypothetical protein
MAIAGLTTTQLPVGQDNVTAKYIGDHNYVESISASTRLPSPSTPPWCTQSAALIGCPSRAARRRSALHCRCQCPRHGDVLPPG